MENGPTHEYKFVEAKKADKSEIQKFAKGKNY